MDGVIKAFPIEKGEQELGLTLRWLKDRIYIQCGWVRHPFDIVATTLHELAHQMVLCTPHHDQCADATGHCLVWPCCVKVITAIFTEAPKLSYFLSTLTNDYGVGWENSLIQSKYSCIRCDQMVDERLMEIRLENDKTEVKTEVLNTSAQMDMMAKLRFVNCKRRTITRR